MRVQMLNERQYVISPLSKKKCPPGSTPEVPDDVAAEWINSGDAVPAPDHGELTAAETAILKTVAQNVAAHAASEPSIDWSQLSDDEIREIADGVGISYGKRAKRQTIIARLDERIDDVFAYISAPSDDAE